MSPRTGWTAMAMGLLVLSLAGGCQEGSSQAAEPEGHGGHEKHEKHEEHETHEEHGGREGHAGHASDDEKVQIPPETLDSYDITVEQVQTGRLGAMVEATAKVRHDVERVAHITPMVKGQISQLHVSLGDRVEKGQRVATIRSVELGSARAAVEEAKAMREVAEANFERQKKLKRLEIASERAFIEARGELKEAKARYQAALSRLHAYDISSRGGRGPSYPLRAKISGTVIEQHAALGETKGPNDTLFKVADQSEIWVIGQVSEKDIHRVEKGMKAAVTLDAYPARSWEGSVDWVSSTVDEKTRLLPVRVTLENPGDDLKPGMFGAIQLKPAAIQNPVPLAPIDAVQKVGGKDVVFVPGDQEGDFKPKGVDLGTEANGLVEVTSGLQEDARIVTSGAFDLKAALTAKGRSAAHHH